MRAVRIGLGLALVLGLAGFFALPLLWEGLAAQQPHAASWVPPLAPNLSIARAERLLPSLKGVAAMDRDESGSLLLASLDGRILRWRPGAAEATALALAPTRALGLHSLGRQRLLIADESGSAWLLTGHERKRLNSEAEGQVSRYLSQVRVSGHGEVLLLEASTRYGAGETYGEFLENAPNGRLLRYNDLRDAASVLVPGLHFPTGLTLGPQDDYLLISEMTRQRVLRHWLRGARAGQTEVFVEHLPGYPDGLHWNGRETFWLAMAGPRSPALDAAAAQPWLARLFAALPGFLQPRPEPMAWVLGFDTQGRMTHNLQAAGDGVYGPISSVFEHEGWLYLGSLGAQGLARLAVPLAPSQQEAP